MVNVELRMFKSRYDKTATEIEERVNKRRENSSY